MQFFTEIILVFTIIFISAGYLLHGSNPKDKAWQLFVKMGSSSKSTF